MSESDREKETEGEKKLLIKSRLTKRTVEFSPLNKGEREKEKKKDRKGEKERKRHLVKGLKMFSIQFHSLISDLSRNSLFPV